VRFKIIVAVLVLAFFAAAFALSSSRQTRSSSTGGDKSENNLVVNQEMHDFGTISMKDGKVKYVYKVKNVSKQPVTIAQVYSSCMCTEVSISIGDKAEGPFGMLGHGNIIPRIDLALGAGTEALVEAIFDPNAHGPAGVGEIERSVFIIEGPQNTKHELKFKATVTP
jgi:hypothetical protein